MEKEYFYPNWRTKTGVPIPVIKLQFVGYGSPFTIDDINYEEQRWKCKLPSGKKATLKFRELRGDSSETSLYENLNPLIDSSTNPIMNTREEIESGEIGEGSFMLKIEEEKSLILIATLEDFKNRGCRLYAKLLRSPSMKVLQEWRDWKKSNPEEHEKFQTILWELKSMI